MVGKTSPSSAPPFSYGFEASTTAPRAVAVILETLREVIIGNQGGVAGRLGEEFLHDYRVAVRRTRAALSLFGSAVPPAMSRRGRRFFRDLGRRTNAARDLDVLLLELPGYAESLANRNAAGIGALGGEITKQNAREYAAIRRWLESGTYGRFLETWRLDVSALAVKAEGPPSVSLAAAAISKAASKAFKEAETLDRKRPDEAVHRMRIRFKKLRYALEFTRSLAPEREIEPFIFALKRLQDQLGVYQDLVVHHGWIARFAKVGGADDELARAGDRLIAELRDRRERLRVAIRAETPVLVGGLRGELERVLAGLGKSR